jgi:hypothetical protein
MTALTLQRSGIRQPTMKSSALLHVTGDVLVTIQTQRRLTHLVGTVMAIAASAFQFGMRITHLAGHQQGFNARRRRDANQ